MSNFEPGPQPPGPLTTQEFVDYWVDKHAFYLNGLTYATQMIRHYREILQDEIMEVMESTDEAG